MSQSNLFICVKLAQLLVFFHLKCQKVLVFMDLKIQIFIDIGGIISFLSFIIVIYETKVKFSIEVDVKLAYSSYKDSINHLRSSRFYLSRLQQRQSNPKMKTCQASQLKNFEPNYFLSVQKEERKGPLNLIAQG